MARDILKTPTEGVPLAYTPRPWFRSGVRQKIDGMDNHSICAIADGKEIIIASVWYDPKTHEGFHDARLIAAAPDLLDALQYLSELYDRIYFDISKTTDGEIQAMKRAWEISDAAIAKATGQ